MANREPVKATQAYQKIIELAPRDPRGPYLVGVALLAQGNRGDARRHFEAALGLAPRYAEPMAQLVSIALGEKKPEAALSRLQKQIALAPGSGEMHMLLGEVHRVQGDLAGAEGAYLRALELQPRLVAAHLKLGELYAQQGNNDQALARLEAALRVNPRDITTLMASGIVYEQRGDFARAQDAYEKALSVNPRFAPAANNLAYLLNSRGGDKDRALQLAQMAKEVAPDEPRFSDTLGWILYSRGVYQRAHALLKESAAGLPENPVIQYHLGMAALKIGDRETARKSLAAAAASPKSFAGKQEAREALRQLQ